METRVFGKTGLQVSVLGLGAAEIGFENASHTAVDALLGVAVDAGINVIDTAECYLDSEEKLGRALGSRRKEVFLFTKCGHAPMPRPAPIPVRICRRLWRPVAQAAGWNAPDWSPRLLQRTIDRSLRRLRTDYIDVIHLHSCSEEVLLRGEAVEILRRAREAGKVRYLGYSGDGRAALCAIQCGNFESLQTSVNILDQQAIDTSLPLARRCGMGVIAKRPVGNAVWRNSCKPANSYHHVYWERLQRLNYPFLRNSVGFETALRFTLSVPGVHTAIVGTTNPAHWRKNAEIAAQRSLEADRFESIRARWKQVADENWIGQE